MLKVEIYSTLLCPYCSAAKRLLSRYGVIYDEVDVTFNSEGRLKMTKRAGGKTSVPQIFIDGVHIGGCDELVLLDRAGTLAPLLNVSQHG
jgi:glutaredoxin 3